jgi:RNA polymerase primary sigma factor
MKQLKISQRLTDRTNDSFKQYLKDISEIAIFTPEEELVCAQKAVNGDKKAIDELVSRNLRFVVSVAKQYATDGIPLEDLVNEGNIGLMMAAEKFTPAKGYKFISYAVWWIRKVILEHITKHGKLVRLPANKINSLSKLSNKIKEMEQTAGRSVDITEVMDELSNEITDDDFMFLDVLSKYSMDSLDRQITNSDDNSGTSLGDLIADNSFKPTDHLITDLDLKEELSATLDILKPRDKKIMISLFGLDGCAPMTLKEVGDEIGITREMVRQVREKSLRALRSNNRVRVAYDNIN